MAANVFGNSITDATLMQLPDYVGKEIRRKDRAKVALDWKNTENKDQSALLFVEGLKRQSGDGVSTLCLVYNATGDPITLIDKPELPNWLGHIGQSPYPRTIANGQWGAFLHVKRSGTPDGSEAAVVYRGLNNDGKECDWMFAWSNPWGRILGYDNKVYTQIREAGYFSEKKWDNVKDSLLNSGLSHEDEWDGCKSTVATGSDTSPKLEAVFTLLQN